MKKLEEHSGSLATAAVVWSDLVYGVQRLPEGQRRTTIEQYLVALQSSDLQVLPYDLEGADWHGRERARLAGVGATRPFVDGQIAAVAWRNGLTLVTRNTKDFENYEGLEVRNWFV